MVLKTTIRFGILIAAMVLPMGEAGATRVFHVPMSQMAQESDVVIHARVLDRDVRWDRGRTRILSFYTIQVLEGIKGAGTGEILTISQVGGSIDGHTYRIIGNLVFRPGEEIVFFAKRFEDTIVSYGIGLGKYVVQHDKANIWVLPDFGDVQWMERSPSGFVPSAPPNIKPQALRTFIRDIRDAVAIPRGGAR